MQKVLSRLGGVCAIALGVAVFGGTANAALIESGAYRLFNHPDGSLNPPPYGARFDGLYGNPAHDYTMDFEAAGSAMFMDVDLVAGTIRIYGTALGGRDIGGVYDTAAPTYGFYDFDFIYNGITQVPGDDDYWFNGANHSNSGTIVTPLGTTVNIVDEADVYTFRLGNENNDLGHRGFNGISGWGWLSYVADNGTVLPHVYATDWLFTAELIPTPGAIALMGMGGLLMARRRR